MTYELQVVGREWLNLNDRGHWAQRARRIADWRSAAAWRARAAKVPRLERAKVVAYVLVPDRRRRDPHNWTPTAKACIDGLVDVGVLVDDSARYLDGPDMRLRVEVVRYPTLELLIDEAAPHDA
jgi:hypothetical protein